VKYGGAGLAAGIVRKLWKIWTANDISKVTKVTLYKTVISPVGSVVQRWDMDTEAGTPEETASVWDGGAEENLWRHQKGPEEEYWHYECVGHRRRRSRAASETETGHVSRIQPERYPHTLLHGHISGRRPQGRPRKKWIDNVKENCNRLELTLTEAARAAQERHHWRSIVRNLGYQRARTTPSSPRH